MSKALQSVLSKLSTLRGLASQPSSRRQGKRILGGLAVLLAAGFFLAPPVLESVLEKQLAKSLRGEVRIDDLAINPLVLSVTVKGLAVVREGKEQAAFDELYVNLSAASLFKLAVVVDEIRLAGLHISVARTGDGQYDISDLLEQWMKPDETPDKTPPRFSLNNIQLVGAGIHFADHPREREFVVTDLNLSLPFLSSLPYQAEILVQPMLSANVNGSSFRLDGQTTPFADGRESELRFDLAGFDLTQLQPYLPAGLPVKIAAARLDSQIRAVFRELPGGVNSLVFVGNARLADLQLQQGDGQALLAWKALAVELSKIDPFNRQFVVQRLALDGLALDLSVNRRGELNLLALAGGRSAAPVADAPAAPVVHWSLGEFVLNDATLRWRDSSGSKPVNGEIRQLSARLGPLDEKLASVEVIEAGALVDFGEQLQLPSLAVKALRVDLAGQRVEIGEVSNAGARIVLRRNADGEIEWLTPPRLKAVAGSAQKPASAPWFARVSTLAVDDLGLRFEDRSVQPVAVQQIDGLSLRGERLGNLANEKGRLSLQATVNKQGKLSVDGDLQAEPFASNLKIDGQAIPLATLQGYSGQFLNVLLQRGQFSAKGDASLRLERGRLLAGYKGSATLGNLLLVDPENKADFLKWKSLHLGGVDFRLDPMRIDIREIALSDFYSRLILNEAGRLNLADIVRQPAAPAAEAEATTVAATERAPLPLSIARVTLNNGTVNFSDRFVRPNYTVDIGKLGGRVTGLSSVEGTVAELELRGSYGRAAPVSISAKLNPLAAKSFLDLKAEVKDVDLTGFSPYSGKYAGYLIDKGKLSLNLAYKLENQQLTASNGLFLDQLTLGERVDSPEATSLPVNLAIALLRNNRGEIDINLPISGSLDDPQFSLGGVIVKVIVNLFVKAVTSPFALLGSMFGDGEELSTLAFAPGQTQIDAAAGKKLEALAQALNDRSALKLDITGHADPETDREGLKRFAIEQAMQREKLADLRKQGKDAETTSIEPAEYPAYLVRVYKAAKFPKPRNFIGLQKELPVEEMEKLLLTHLPASDADLGQLARVRAEQVQAWLLDQGKVAPGQIFLVPPKSGKASGQGGRVEFSLR